MFRYDSAITSLKRSLKEIKDDISFYKASRHSAYALQIEQKEAMAAEHIQAIHALENMQLLAGEYEYDYR